MGSTRIGENLHEDLTLLAVFAVAHVGPKTDTGTANAVLDDLVQAGERAAADEQDVRRVDLDEFLMGMLAAALGWDRGRGALKDLEQRLLDALA